MYIGLVEQSTFCHRNVKQNFHEFVTFVIMHEQINNYGYKNRH